MHISQTNRTGDTNPNRNLILLHAFGERILDYTKGFDFEKLKQINYDSKEMSNDDRIDKIMQGFGSPNEIAAFLDKFTIAFGKHLVRLMNEAPRTLEHSVEDILASFREDCLTSGIYSDREKSNYEPCTHCPGACPL